MPNLETTEVTITTDIPCTQSSNTIYPHCNLLPDTIPHLRPGKQHNRTTNSDIHRSYGDSYLDRNDNDVRIFFQNVKGLTYSHTGEDYDYYMTSTQAIGADIVGMAETNTAWQHIHLRSCSHQELENITERQKFSLDTRPRQQTSSRKRKHSNLEAI